MICDVSSSVAGSKVHWLSTGLCRTWRRRSADQVVKGLSQCSCAVWRGGQSPPWRPDRHAAALRRGPGWRRHAHRYTEMVISLSLCVWWLHLSFSFSSGSSHRWQGEDHRVQRRHLHYDVQRRQRENRPSCAAASAGSRGDQPQKTGGQPWWENILTQWRLFRLWRLLSLKAEQK